MFTNRLGRKKEGHMSKIGEKEPLENLKEKFSSFFGIPRGIAALGYTQQQPTEDRYLMTRSELLDRLAVLLGGRVRRGRLFLKKSLPAPRTTLQRATDIACSMVTEYGMSDRLEGGKIWKK